MATMDTIKIAGGEPANFLDIGGGATPERVAKAFRLVMSDQNVQAVLVNIFAGINRCDWVAEGVVLALQENPVDVPVIVRLSGTNVEEGQKILARSGLPIIRATTLAEAAERAVGAWKSDQKPGCKAEGGDMSILLDRDTRVLIQGHHRQDGTVPCPRDAGLRHQLGGWRCAWKRRRDGGRRSGF